MLLTLKLRPIVFVRHFLAYESISITASPGVFINLARFSTKGEQSSALLSALFLFRTIWKLSVKTGFVPLSKIILRNLFASSFVERRMYPG